MGIVLTAPIFIFTGEVLRHQCSSLSQFGFRICAPTEKLILHHQPDIPVCDSLISISHDILHSTCIRRTDYTINKLAPDHVIYTVHCHGESPARLDNGAAADQIYRGRNVDYDLGLVWNLGGDKIRGKSRAGTKMGIRGSWEIFRMSRASEHVVVTEMPEEASTESRRDRPE